MSNLNIQKWLALIGLSLLSFTAFLDYTIVATALPFIQKDLNASVLQLQWVMSIFALILCMFMIVCGKLGDLFGRHRVFYFSFVLFAIAAIGAGAADTIQQLIFFRAIQGLSAASIFTLGVALLPQAFPATEQTRAIGIFSAFNGAGLALGPFLGGALITYLNWRWVFWINIPIIFVGFLFCLFTLKPSPRPTKINIDWLGFILLVVGLGNFIYGIIRGGQIGFSDVLTLITVCVGIFALISLIFVERKINDPLLNLGIVTHPPVLLSILICIVAGLITAVFLFFDPLYLEIIRNQNAFTVGMTLLSVPIVQVGISLLLNRLVKKFSINSLLIFGLLTAVMSGILHLLFTADVSIFIVLFALMLMGYTWGIANAGSITAVHQSIPSRQLGSAIGTIFTFWNISSAVCLALASILFHWREKYVLDNALTNASLSDNQIQQLHSLIANPESILQSANTSMNLVAIFSTSFMNAFHWVAFACTLFMLVIFIISIRLRQL